MNWLEQARAEIRSWGILAEDWSHNMHETALEQAEHKGRADGYRRALDSLKYWERMEREGK